MFNTVIDRRKTTFRKKERHFKVHLLTEGNFFLRYLLHLLRKWTGATSNTFW